MSNSQNACSGVGHIYFENLKTFPRSSRRRFLCIKRSRSLMAPPPYESLTKALENDPPPEVRMDLWHLAREALQHSIVKEYSVEKVQKFIGKISNGFEYWFTFIIHPGVEPTNNRAERALRLHVVLRKILGTLRNDKGTSIHERIMTILATCGQKGLDSLQMLTAKLAS